MVPLNLLVIEDNLGDFILLSEMLQGTGLSINQVQHSDTLDDGLRNLQYNTTIDLIFLDLSLPDSHGLNTFMSIQENASHIPVIILSGMSDITISLQALSMGAQDYLVKGDYNERLLNKTVQYSIERKRTQLHLQESNKRYELVSQATHDAIWDWNPNTNEMFIGGNFGRQFGYAEQGSTADIKLWELNIHPDDRKRVFKKLHKAMENPEAAYWEDEYRFRRADGSYAYVYDRAYIVHSSNGLPVRVISAMQDITDRKKLEEQLIQDKIIYQKRMAQATLDGQEKERTEIAKELHDNINQILATTKLFLDAAQEDETIKDEMINRSVTNISRAMEEIRKLSKALVTPSLGDLSLTEAIAELADTIQATTALKITVRVKQKAANKVSEQQQIALFRIIQEQLNNIIKHANATQVVIVLESFDNSVRLTIHDNGKGFNMTIKRKGIGLSNIQNRAELLNGNLQIISEEGAGCLLKVTLPL